MRALLCREFGPPERLVVEDVPAPTPAAGQVVVRVKAAGVNFPDSLIIQNKYQIKATPPFSPGGEFAGIVEKVGEGATRFAVGEAVIGFTGWGAFAEEIVVAQEHLVPMPEGMPFEVAGAFLMTYGTCYHALEDRAQVKPGETVLVLGAAGGIGIASIEVAKAMGARVIAAAASADKLRTCTAHGADETIDYEAEDLRSRIDALTGKQGVDVVVDPVGGRFADPAFRSLRWRGRYLVVGFASGEIPKLPLNLPLLKGASIAGVFWGSFLRREPVAAENDVRDLAALYRAGKIAPLISGRYSLEQAPEAIRALSLRKVQGKVIVLP